MAKSEKVIYEVALRHAENTYKREKAAAKYAYNSLIEKNLLSDREEKGKNTFYVSDSVSLFEENAGNFLGHPVNGDVFSCSLGD